MPTRSSPPSWRELHPGEDPQAEARQFAHWRSATPSEKIAELVALNAMMLRLLEAGLRRRHPSADDATLRRMLADLVLGCELADAAFGGPGRGSPTP